MRLATHYAIRYRQAHGNRKQAMLEKRAGQRRNYALIRTFPLIDDRGCIVPFDRSRIPDRRLNNLKVEETGAGFFHQLRMTR